MQSARLYIFRCLSPHYLSLSYCGLHSDQACCAHSMCAYRFGQGKVSDLVLSTRVPVMGATLFRDSSPRVSVVWQRISANAHVNSRCFSVPCHRRTATACAQLSSARVPTTVVRRARNRLGMSVRFVARCASIVWGTHRPGSLWQIICRATRNARGVVEHNGAYVSSIVTIKR